MVTGAILAPPETQRLVVSGKTGTYSSAMPGKDSYVPIDPSGEMVTPVSLADKRNLPIKLLLERAGRGYVIIGAKQLRLGEDMARRNPGRSAGGGSTARSREELATELARTEERLRNLRNSRAASTWAAVLKTLFRCAAVFGSIAVCAAYLHGQTTYLWAKIDAKVSSASLEEIVKSISPSLWWNSVMLLMSMIFFGSNRRFRRVNKDLVARIADITEKYELLVDPSRTSSGIDPSGQAHERDVV